MVRVRFAPSPTGYLHVGGARTALFNWLFARRHGGMFVLRIEDTDVERSSAEMVDGHPRRPALARARLGRRAGRRRPARAVLPVAAARSASRGGRAARRRPATRTTATARRNELKAKRAARRSGGRRLDLRPHLLRAAAPPRSRGAKPPAAPRAVRFRVPDGTTRFDDLVHGPIEFDNANIEDFVILRSDGQPTYHLSVVADDMDMGITHVVRGDDHISNTPKQVLLYEALGAPMPAVRARAADSRPRQEAAEQAARRDVGDGVRDAGLPARGDGQLPRAARLVAGQRRGAVHARRAGRRVSTLEGISGGNAVFNPEKLDWFNQQHIMRLPAGELANRVAPLLRAAGLWRDGFDRPIARGSCGCSSC